MSAANPTLPTHLARTLGNDGAATSSLRIFLAHWGALDYARSNPYLPVQTANWTGRPGAGPQAEVVREMANRASVRQYVFPIDVNSTMRMMTPASARYFRSQNCPPAP